MCETTIINNKEKEFVCVNCGNPVLELYKKFSASVKTINCEKCNQIADKYIEFEPVIILVDSVLLSENAFRHVLYNRDFKPHWKLSIVLLLLESFALWRQKRRDIDDVFQYEMVHEKGFYICCLENIIDNILYAALLYTSLLIMRNSVGQRIKFFVSIVKAIAIANFSKFFILPIMVWRENTTEFGTSIHHLLVMGHHLLSFIFVYSVVSGLPKLQSALVVLSLYVFKEYLRRIISTYLEKEF